MDLGLQGSRALVTGGSKGIGFAVADALAAEGTAVGLVARDAAGLAAAAERLAPRGTPVATASADVTDTPALNRAVDDIAAALGGLDVANVGGTIGRGNVTSAGPDEFTATFALNARPPLRLTATSGQSVRCPPRSAGTSVRIPVRSAAALQPRPRRARHGPPAMTRIRPAPPAAAPAAAG